MQSPTPVAGDPIQARCTKCRKNSNHIISSMAGEKPDEVQCSLCGRQHKYRPPTAAKKPGAIRAMNLKDAERQEWSTLRPSMDDARASDYSMTAAYKVKSLISHPVFGLGLVQRVAGVQKIEVLFEDGKKILRCK